MTTEPLNSQLDLTTGERTIVNAAHEALIALKKTFEHWVMIGRGLETIRAKAERMGGRKTFDRLREQAGLGPQHLDKAVVSRLQRVMDELPAVETWRAILTEKERFDWASPGAVIKHCPVFNRPPSTDPVDKPRSPMAKVKTEIEDLKHDNAHLREQLAAAETRDGSLFDLRRDKVDDIVEVILRSVSQSRARKIASLINERLKEAQPAG